MPCPDESFDFAISEYGAARGATSRGYRRRTGCSAPAESSSHVQLDPVGRMQPRRRPGRERLERDYFRSTADWRQDCGGEFNLPVSVVRLLRDTGFEVVDFFGAGAFGRRRGELLRDRRLGAGSRPSRWRGASADRASPADAAADIVGEARACRLDWRNEEDVRRAEADIRRRMGRRKLDFPALLVANIYRAATTVRNRIEREVLAEVGLTWGGFTILFVLWVWGPMEAASLADECGLA